MSARYRARVTDIGDFVRHRSCQRYFRLSHNQRALFRQLPFSGRPFHVIDPVLLEAGRSREDAWAEALRQAGVSELAEVTDRAVEWSLAFDRLAALTPGQTGYIREVAVSGTVGAFELHGQVDFLLVLWRDGRPRLRLVECKASRRDRTYHRVQVTLYRLLLGQLLAASPLKIAGHSIDPDAIEVVVARIDEATGQGQSIPELPVFPELGSIAHDLRQMLAEDGPLDRILRTELDDLPFQIDEKCDDCALSVHCLTESARQRRLEILGVAPGCVRALTAAGITTIDALAELDRQSPAAQQAAADRGLTESLEILQVLARTRRATFPGGRAESPIRARPFGGRGHLPPHTSAAGRLVRIYLSVSYDYVENRIGALAAHITRSEGELATPFQRDDGKLEPVAGVHEEVVTYLRGDPVAEAEASTSMPRSGRQVDQVRPLQGSDLVRFQTVPWSGIYERDTGLELQLLQGFLRELVERIADVADTEAAPIHFYVWSRSEMKRLLEAASRVGSNLMGHLRQLFGSRESLEQLIYSSLQDEVYSRYALGWTSRGLGVATSLSWFGQRFHWRRNIGAGRKEVDLGRIFYRDIFDFRERLDYHKDDPQHRWARSDERGQPGVVDHRFEVRARSFDNLTAPYWRAYWGTLPSAESLGAHNPNVLAAIEQYREAGRPGRLEAYLLTRAHALRWIEERIRFKNGTIDKPALRLDALPKFTLGTTNNAEAAVDFLRLDHHIKIQDWIRRHLVPPILRVAAGRSIPLRDLQLGSGGNITASIDLSLVAGDLTTLKGHVAREEGDFVRLLARPDADDLGPGYYDLIHGGKTCIIKHLDWRQGTVELSIVPKFDNDDQYILPSFPFKPGDADPRNRPFTRATLDESVSDFIAGRVEKRLLGRHGRHILAWFDPIAPRIPACQALPPATRQQLLTMLERLRFGATGEHSLEPERAHLIADGLESRIQLVQGPPGTGKTTVTSLAVLSRILIGLAPGAIVLVAAHTHTAVDLLLARLRQEFPGFARQAGAANLKMPRIAVRKVNSSGEASDEALPATNCVTALKRLQTDAVVVLGSTVGTLLKLVEGLNKTAAYKGLADGFQAPLLIVDEASMMVLSHFLALASLVRPDGAIMMAGDHRQLAPIMAHDWESEDRPPSVLYKPFVSAYEAVWRLAAPPSRLDAPCVRIDQLAHTHRLPPVIRALIQPLYAQDNIILRGPDEVPLMNHWDGVDPWAAIWRAGQRLYLVVHDEQRSEQFNEVEAAIIDAILGAAPELPPSAVAIVTPHRAQRALLRERLQGRSQFVDLVDTVERLQGGERPTILFSATESDPLIIAQNVEFILDINRSNVAFSRTQERLVVICARTLLDFIPPETDHYASALLWKHLRELCDRELATTTVGGAAISVRVPTLPP